MREGAEQFTGAGSDAKIGSFFIGNAKSFLTTAKQLMRRIRDKVPYSAGDKMMLGTPARGWMVEGSPPRLLRDYNQLVEAYNRGPRNLARRQCRYGGENQMIKLRARESAAFLLAALCLAARCRASR